MDTKPVILELIQTTFTERIFDKIKDQDLQVIRQF